jgi:glycosyltransferase involved in cell wall biosynthesis
MAEGCPVVAARAASLPEVCGDAALYVDPRSSASMTEAMRWLAHEAPLRAALSAAGRQRAAGFTWAETARRLHEALLAGAAGATPPVRELGVGA